MTPESHVLELEHDPETIASRLLNHGRRLLLVGATGSGKSTLAATLAQTISRRGQPVHCISADPGSPAFGLPGSVGLARWQANGWQLQRLEPLCTLDAVRFRLPLVLAVRRLVSWLKQVEVQEQNKWQEPGVLLLDTPGVISAVAGAELIPTLAEVAAIDHILILSGPEVEVPLAAEMTALNQLIYRISPSPLARHPGSAARTQARTVLWNQYMVNAREHRLERNGLLALGTPPPARIAQAWRGLQVALLNSQQAPLAMGEILDADRDSLLLRLGPRLDTLRTASIPLHSPHPLPSTHEPDALLSSRDHAPLRLLLRDAHRNATGLLATRPPFRPKTVSTGSRPTSRRLTPRRFEPMPAGPSLTLGTLHIALVNGVYGDPLLHVQVLNRKRSLLFDLGALSLLPTRATHQATDILITHAHIDHICGFLTLLRSRMGPYPPCRIYGPPGLTEHFQNLLNGVHWDRIGDQGPAFEVGEVHASILRWSRIQAGYPRPVPLGEQPIPDNVLRHEPDFSLRAVTLDHGIPVLAFALRTLPTVHVRPERLQELGWPPGPWVGDLKRLARTGAPHDQVLLPDQSRRALDELLNDTRLIQSQPGKTLVYATDFAGHDGNRQRLVTLAQNADLLVCEASFLIADEAQARATGHLTTRDCATIARDAGVRHLLPFHFSRRYEHRAQEPYQELKRFFPHLITPDSSPDSILQ